MKNLFCGLSIFFIIFGTIKTDVRASEFEDKLKEIRWLESSHLSKEFVRQFGSSQGSDFLLIAQRADATGNIDLLDLIRRRVESEDWSGEKDWKKGLEIQNRILTCLQILSQKNSSIKSNFRKYFLSSPDVPYEQIGEWHRGYSERGLQGSILELMAKYDSLMFGEVVGLIEGDSINLSKKRTIIWAMRFDESGVSERILRMKILTENGLMKNDLSESLKFIESQNRKSE